MVGNVQSCRLAKLLSLALAIAPVLSACSEPPLHPAPIPASAITTSIVAGDGQVGRVAQRLPDPLVVRAVDSGGNPQAGQLVNFVVTSGGGSAFAGSALTNDQGLALEYWTLGPVEGTQTLEARAVDTSTGEKLLFGVFTATAVRDGAAASVTVDPSGMELRVQETRQLTATASDAAGNELSRTFLWSSSDDAVAQVSSDGLITGIAAGAATITATADGRSGTADITVTLPPSGRPATVTAFQVAEVTSTSITIEWTEVGNGAGGSADYMIRYGAPRMGSWRDEGVEASQVTVRGIRSGATLRHTFTDLAPGTRHEFRIRSFRETSGKNVVMGARSKRFIATTLP
jgi:hypothetical protein